MGAPPAIRDPRQARARVRVGLALGVGLAVVPGGRARAQVRSDAAVDVGVVKRFVSGAGARDAGVGPTLGLNGHVALFPMVRVGAYASAEISPGELPVQASARRIYAAGLRVKLSPPWPREDVRAWLFTGLGFAGVYAPSYRGAVTSSDGAPIAADALVAGAGGHFFEVPIGVGASYRLRKPWVLTAELAARVGFAFSGAIYTGGRGAIDASSSLPVVLGAPGHDAFALGLTLGIGFDR